MNYYAAAIDELFKEHDWQKVAMDYAKKHQADFLRACNGSADKFKTVRELIKAGNKIAAIKEFRAITGASLKDAKYAVEEMQEDQCH